MANFSERFLLGFTSPRSPYLISKYIKVIEENNLDGKMYNSNFQKEFYNVLLRCFVYFKRKTQRRINKITVDINCNHLYYIINNNRKEVNK